MPDVQWIAVRKAAASGDYEHALRLAASSPEVTLGSSIGLLQAAQQLSKQAEKRGESQLVLETLEYAVRAAQIDTVGEAEILCDLQMHAGELNFERGNLREAAAVLRVAQQTAQAYLGEESPAVGAAANMLGVVFKALGRYSEAQSVYAVAQRVFLLHYGAVSDAYATVLHNIAGLAHARRQPFAGLDAARESVRIRESLHGLDHVLVAADVANLGGLLFDAGQPQEAETCFRRALTIFEREFGQDHLEVAVNLSNLAAIARLHGDHSRAEELFRRALAIKERSQGTDHPDTLLTRYNLAHHLADLDRSDAARQLLRPVIHLLGDLVDPEHTVYRKAQGLARRLEL